MNTITTEQPINNQSFFKLPFILIAIFFVVCLLGTQILNLTTGIFPEFFWKTVILTLLSILLPIFLFFMTAVFCCQKYRLHAVSDSWQKVSLIAIIFSMLYIGWLLLYPFINGFILQLLYNRMNKSDVILLTSVFSLLIKIVIYFLFIWILAFLFNIFAKKDSSLRAIYKLEGVTGSHVYSHIYSSLMMFVWLIVVSFVLSRILASKLIDSESNSTYIIFLLISYIFLFISYFTFYFSTRNCFKRIEPTIKFEGLILTAFLTYLLIFMTNAAIGGALFFVSWSYIMLSNFVSIIAILISILILFIVGFIINLFLFFKFSRFSVKVMYR